MEPTLTIRRVPLDSLHLDPSNARSHGPENMEAILGSLKQFRQAEPLVVQKSTGRVIGGNGRLVAMKQLGWTECDVVEVDLDDLNATALGIALNRSSELAAWNDSTLAKLLQELKVNDALDGVGYSNEDIGRLLDQLQLESGGGTGIDPDEIPEPPEEAVTRPGDLWSLGRHRLLCGDSAKAEDVDRLLAGAPVHLVNTDPPYNVRVEPRSNNAIAAGLSSFKAMHHQKLDHARFPSKAKPTHQKLRAKDRPLENDFVSEEEFNRLLHAWFGNMARVLEPGRSLYIWGGYANLGNYPPVLKANGLYFSQGIVWVKEHPVLTRKDFMGNFELAFYSWKEGAAHKFFGPTNAVDVWSVKKVNPQAMLHLTEKPVELASRAILYSSERGENVLDLFGGSGSTLIAAEETGRKAFLMEIDPLYSDVILTRFEKFTGKKAVLEATGESFEEVSSKRKAEASPCSTGS
jgi:DNA modification methylase